jgi:hypothetical protein
MILLPGDDRQGQDWISLPLPTFQLVPQETHPSQGRPEKKGKPTGPSHIFPSARTIYG